jgi:hypothetical protein
MKVRDPGFDRYLERKAAAAGKVVPLRQPEAAPVKPKRKSRVAGVTLAPCDLPDPRARF